MNAVKNTIALSILFCVLCIPFTSFSYVNPTRDLIILLDYGSKDESLESSSLGGVSQRLFFALMQEAAPIIVTGQLLKNCFSRKQLFETLVASPTVTEDLLKLFPYLSTQFAICYGLPLIMSN